ncbi:hypothetical protein [Methylobacterium sp. GC_Met_2]|uniref:hypothetical protein n=1 Tax=Methylobacterium sp. GC_Met_2 TaxID=2937376 RepID=UPI00226BBA25|nr:hypothetical protein [Methylobacterium sp. GC_Met_2]
MTRVAEIADYLLSTATGDTAAAWKAEVVETIMARWPDVTREDLTAAFEVATLEAAAELAVTMADNLDRLAAAALRIPVTNPQK